MRITKEELEKQGIFVPTKVDDELLARFRAGSVIVLNVELVDPLESKHWRAPRFFQISEKSNVFSRDFHNFIFRLEHDTQFNDADLYQEDGTPFIAWRPDINMFNKILVCLERNC
jgi:hypothetical protein